MMPQSVGLAGIFSYLLDLAETGLSYASIRVHLSAMSVFHPPIDGKTVFSHLDSKQFLKPW